MNPIQFGRPLSQNQIACLALLAQRKTRKEMAYDLGVNPSTIYSRFQGMRESIYIFATMSGVNWDAQMAAWTVVNSRKLSNYVRALKTQDQNPGHLTQRQLWLDSGLELIKDR